MLEHTSDIAFTPAVKAIQKTHGSRGAYARMEQNGSWPATVTPDLREFIATLDMFYLATANGEGQPYIQYRGGPRGFLKVLDDRTLGFADFRGNRQYITAGNLAENPRVSIFLMDYVTPSRVKIWGNARVVEDDPALMARLADPSYKGTPERAILLDIAAWDANCQQHIHRRIDRREAESAMQGLRDRVRELESELASLRA